ncbi:MAG: hypothetical protein O2919_04060 [Chloroflexi bacterium]|nr:hypothetical protein [Chloroflexota bacterium]
MPVPRAVRAILLGAMIALVAAPPVALPRTAGAADTAPRASSTTRAIDGEPLTPGSTAVVEGDGDCLRLRESPGLGGRQVGCIPDGATLTVLPNVVEIDGYRWQFVSYRQQSGWVADEFLAPFDGPASSDSCSAPAVPPGITGTVPSSAGFGLVVWGGGTVHGVQTLAMTEGCQLRSIWGSLPGGGLVGYQFGAPDFVNRAWLTAYPGGSIRAGTPLIMICQPADSNISAIASVPLPAPTRAAPAYTGTATPPTIDARAAIVVDEASGEVLFQYNGYEPLPPASLTKIVTAILAIEATATESWVHVADVDYRQMPGSSVMGIVPGDCFLMRDLLYGLMLPSGNDAALAIGRYAAGSDDAFIHQMNTLALRLGLTTSNFTDAHGLGGPGHRMSAYDVAMFSRYAMPLPAFRDIVAAPNWTASGDRVLSMRNVNSFMSLYPGADGVKTGFTESAGRTLAASATRNGQRVYVVLLNAFDRNADAERLLNWVFDNHTW